MYKNILYINNPRGCLCRSWKLDLGATTFFLVLLCNLSITCMDLSLRKTFILAGAINVHIKNDTFQKAEYCKPVCIESVLD